MRSSCQQKTHAMMYSLQQLERDPSKHYLKQPAAKGCTEDGTLAIVPIYIPILN
jgi:hypothetical protein